MSAPNRWRFAAPTLIVGVVFALWADAPIVRRLHHGLPPALDAFFGDVSELVDATALSVVTLAVWGISHVVSGCTTGWRLGVRWDRVRRGSLFMLLTLLTGGLVTLGLKLMVARARPSMLLAHERYGLAAPFTGAPFDSFPSSHAFTAFAAAGVLAHLMPRWRVPLMTLAVLASLCRVLTLEHFPSDVLASACIAIACVRFWAARIHSGQLSRPPTMKTPHLLTFATLGLALGSTALSIAIGSTGAAASTAPATHEPAAPQSTAPPALTVVASRLQPTQLPIRVAANGNILPWQEAIVGAEANGLRIAEVRVNVGDTVRRGQLLASFATETIAAELAHSRAVVAEAEAALDDATANAQRGRVLQDSGALSGQQIQQYATAERAARARLDAARAVERTSTLRLAQSRLLAPDDGVISARTATVGAVVPAGQELFRLIRGGRLEWRAEVAAADLARLASGQKVRVAPTGGEAVEGRLRMLAPAIDILSRNGLAYVDLPPGAAARAGMFARGEFDLGTVEVPTLPQAAVLLREGFSYVMRVGPDSRIVQTRVTAGRRSADRIEILEGLGADDRVVAAGAAFLGDGDIVHVAEEPGR